MKYFLTVLFILAVKVHVYAQMSQGFFLNDWQPKDIRRPEFEEAQKPNGPTDVLVSVDFADTLTRVPNFIYGNNANTWSTIMYDNPDLLRNIRNLAPHVLRYPGGNLSNSFFWRLRPNERPSDMPANVDFRAGFGLQNWEMGVDDYYIFLDSTDTEGVISVNYSYARYGTSENPVQKAAHMAADWVRYDNGRTRFWEIGNENFGNWQAGYTIDTSLNKDGQPATISGAVYGEHCRVFIDSMRAAAAETGHEIHIGVVAFEDENSWDPVQTNWNETMMPLVAPVADFYSVHNYFTPYQENTAAISVLNSYTRARDFKAAVLADLSDAGFGPAPVAFTEWNIFAQGSMQQVSHINGLHALLVLGETIRQGYGMTTRWDLANGWDNGNDHGIFSRGEPGVQEWSPRPAFYTMTWFQRYFGDVMIRAEAASNDIVAFASGFNSGQSGIVIVNKSRSEWIVEINIDNYQYGERYFWYTFVGDNDNGDFSRKVIINDKGPAGIAGGPENYDLIPAYSDNIADGVKISSPAFSATFLLVEGDFNPVSVRENTNTQTPQDFALGQNYPNPFNPRTRIDYYLPQGGSVKLVVYDILGSKVRTLVSDQQSAGSHSVVWDGRNSAGQQVASGAYFYELSLTSNGFETIDRKKMMFVK